MAKIIMTFIFMGVSAVVYAQNTEMLRQERNEESQYVAESCYFESDCNPEDCDPSECGIKNLAENYHEDTAERLVPLRKWSDIGEETNVPKLLNALAHRLIAITHEVKYTMVRNVNKLAKTCRGNVELSRHEVCYGLKLYRGN